MHSEAGGSSAPGSPEVPEMVEPSKTEQRKAEHVNIILQENVSAEYNYWNDVRLVHYALPEVDLDAIDLSVKFFGKKLRAPLIISSMTGGFGMGKEINANLAKAAAEVGVAMGVGSQRAALEKPELAATYAVVKDHGIPLVFANLGAPQLVPQEGKRAYGIADAKRAIDMIDADALIIHLNFLQEVVQPEGDRRAKGCLAAIRTLAAKFPVMAKETGAGISREAATRLKEAGVQAIDVGGLGGTSFSAVEHYRARKEASSLKERLGATFWNWGIPTPASIRLADVGLPLIATGGIRSGLDAAKGIALGATVAGMAKPMLEAAKVSADAVVAELRAVIEELKAAMFLTGSTSIPELQERKVIVSPPTLSWLEARETVPVRPRSRRLPIAHGRATLPGSGAGGHLARVVPSVHALPRRHHGRGLPPAEVPERVVLERPPVPRRRRRAARDRLPDAPTSVRGLAGDPRRAPHPLPCGVGDRARGRPPSVRSAGVARRVDDGRPDPQRRARPRHRLRAGGGHPGGRIRPDERGEDGPPLRGSGRHDRDRLPGLLGGSSRARDVRAGPRGRVPRSRRSPRIGSRRFADRRIVGRGHPARQEDPPLCPRTRTAPRRGSDRLPTGLWPGDEDDQA